MTAVLHENKEKGSGNRDRLNSYALHTWAHNISAVPEIIWGYSANSHSSQKEGGSRRKDSIFDILQDQIFRKRSNGPSGSSGYLQYDANYQKQGTLWSFSQKHSNVGNIFTERGARVKSAHTFPRWTHVKQKKSDMKNKNLWYLRSRRSRASFAQNNDDQTRRTDEKNFCFLGLDSGYRTKAKRRWIPRSEQEFFCNRALWDFERKRGEITPALCTLSRRRCSILLLRLKPQEGFLVFFICQ